MGLIGNEGTVHACVFINYINFVYGVKNKLDEKKSENYIIAKQKKIYSLASTAIVNVLIALVSMQVNIAVH